MTGTGPRLVEGPIGPTLRRMTVPMVLGIAAVVTFTLVDTFFIGLLGTAPLAAVGFTFPVTLGLTHLAMGLAVGTSAIVGRTLGAEEADRARRQVADSVLLALVAMTALAALAAAVMDPLFALLGAESDLRPLIRAYMGPWLAGVPLLVVTMVGNSALRASGDTLTPSLIMALGGLINGGLDPLLIFGWGPVPGFGLQGAALASVASWVVVLAVNQYWLAVRRRLVAWYRPRLGELMASWRAHLRISLPAAGSNVMPPIANGVLTALVARHGAAAVAGFGVGIRIEAFALVVALAFAGALAPFVSQNFGAGRMDRVTTAYRGGVGFLVAWELAVYALLALPAPWIAALFTDDPAVAAALVLFLWIRPAGYGFQAALIASSATLNALHRPYHALALGLLRLFIFYLPPAYAGGLIAGVPGIYAGATLGTLALGAVAVTWLLRRILEPSPP
ncbi:MATE family efflux transporter [Thiohalorhabdus sp.]|uniref:MATE family efflux transporter n=1 Tax=Thiohalorhabdus sp. TaxID=3094134 RepID=UPI002FC33781